MFPIGFFCGNFVSSRVGNRMSNETMVLIGSSMAMMTVTIQALVVLSGTVTPMTLFIPGFFITFSQGIALPYAQVGAMAAVAALAGTAAGVGVFMQNFFGATFTQIYGLIADGTPRRMALVAMISAAFGLAAGALPYWLKRRRRIEQSSSPRSV
jgi:DHA1 family bicyclomycin/chloramphenicol resistance-like MFS transporter